MGETQYTCNNGNRLIFETEDSEYSCLCTFPHNYEVGGKKLNKWIAASLALLGAGIAISANKPSSMNNLGNEFSDTYYLPDCIPRWIRDELDRVLELSKDDDINEEEEEIMQELTFVITNMDIQRSMGGKTNLRAKCIQDNMLLDIEIKNSEITNKSLIKQKLIEEYNRILKLKEKHKDDINVGTIL